MTRSDRGRVALAIAAFLAWAVISARAEETAQLAVARVSYQVSLAGAAQHLVQVKLSVAPGASECELQLPVWNALYQIRDFSQYVTWVRARSDRGLPLAVPNTSTRPSWNICASRRSSRASLSAAIMREARYDSR